MGSVTLPRVSGSATNYSVVIESNETQWRVLVDRTDITDGTNVNVGVIWSLGSSATTAAGKVIFDKRGQLSQDPVTSPWMSTTKDGENNLTEGATVTVGVYPFSGPAIATYRGSLPDLVDATPDASVAATINVPATGAERTTVRLSANVTGNYDSITYAWTVAEGTLNNASSATPTWTRPTVSSGKTVAINLSVSVTGTGTNAKSNTSANASATAVSPRVTDNTPVASAPSVTIDSVAAGREGTTVSLSAALTGGTYDSLEYTWTVAEGTLNDATAQSPTWTRPQVSATKNVAIGLSLKAKGTGTKADPGTSATVNATAVNASVTDTPLLPLAVAPSVTIDSVADGNENTTVKLTATISGGTYDGIDYLWTVGGGTLDDATLESPTWTRPAVSADTDYNINLRVTAKGTGTNARSGSSTQKNAGHVVATVKDVPAADTTAPTLSSSVTNTAGTKITLTYNEALDTASVPANGDFSVTSGGAANAVTNVDVLSTTVTLTLTTTVANGETVLVSYTKGTNPIQDSAGNDAANLTDESTTNNVPAATLPVADAPAVSINNIATGQEGTTVQLGALLTGGTYDSITYAWTVAEGTLNDATIATPTWTRPTVTATKNISIGLSITANGTGTNARSGTSDTAAATAKNASVTDTPAAGVSYQAMELRAGWHDYQATPKRHRWDPSASERPQIIDTLIDSRDIFLSRFLIRDDLIAMQFTTDRLGGLTSHAGADLSSTFETGGYIGIDDGDGHTVVFQVTEFDNTDSLEPYAWRMSGAATTKMAAFISELTAVSATQAITLTLWDGEGDSPFTEPEESTFTNVSVTGSTVVLTLRSAITSGQTLELDYTKGTNPIQDAAGNDAANLVDESVTNNVT